LPKNKEGKTPVQNFTEKAKNARKVYRIAMLAPWIFGALAVVSGGLVILLYDDKRRGMRNLAITTLVLGILTLVGIFVSNFGFSKLEKSDSLLQVDANIKEPVIALVRSISIAYNNRLLMFGIVYVAIGAATLTALRLTKPKHPQEHNKPKEAPKPPAAQSQESLVH
jgi:hypothetical protein